MTAAAEPTPLLSVAGLMVDLRSNGGWRPVVRGIDYRIDAGRTMALVGESGSGKTLSVMALLGLHPGGVRYQVAGSATFDGIDLLGLSERQIAGIRGGQIGVVFQDPLAALNPLHRVGDQVAEVIRIHRGMTRAQARARALDLLSHVGIPSARQRMDDHPHQFSGGMRQRAMIAMAIAAEPRLLIADEPTSALDVTIQAQILDLLGRLREELSMALLLITHDLGIVAGVADSIGIMYAGRIVENGPTDEVMRRPDHPYTLGLLASIPRIDGPRQTRLQAIPGAPPGLASDIVGCAFAPRCPLAADSCRTIDPRPVPVGEDHDSACLLQPGQGRPSHPGNANAGSAG